MKVVRPPQRYPSIEAFHAEVPDVDRRLSPELEFGVQWTEAFEVGWTWPRSRLVWVEHTGELVVVRESRFSRKRNATVKVVAVVEGRVEIERVLEGWAHHCGPEGLRWVYRRLDHAETFGTAGATSCTGGCT